MRNYEAMFIIKPDLSGEDRKTLFDQINDTVTKNKGNVSGGKVWSERKKLYFSIKKYSEAVFYLVDFNLSDPALITQIKRAYKLNENILRVLIMKVE